MGLGQTPLKGYRWFVIAAAFVVMMIISIYQYSWFLFGYAIQEQLGWDLATIGLTFTIFAYTATFVQPFSGLIADSHGPRKTAMAGSILVGVGFVLASFASSPQVLYCFYGLGGIGVGVLYGISTACAIKWFPERRGFATGFVVFGFGAGTALFNWAIEGLLDARGFRATFLGLGVAMIITLIPLSLFYRYPQGSHLASSDFIKGTKQIRSDFKPVEMLRTSQWFLMYFSFTVTVSVVLMFGAQLKMLAEEFGVRRNYFSVLMVVFPLGNGLSRVVAGTVSDRLGRERTMMVFYFLLGLSILSLVMFARSSVVFVVIGTNNPHVGGAPVALYTATKGE